MTKLKLASDKLEMWLHQNHAFIEECAEGCLLDNYLVTTKRGQAAIIETPVNCWTSCYTVYFSTDGETTELYFDIIGRRATA